MLVATWNVNSITVRLPQVLEWLDKVRPNVLCLQETKVIDEKFPVKAFAEIGFTVETFGEKTYNGVAIISDKPLTDVRRGFKLEVGPGSKRLIMGTYDSVRIIDVYIPNGSEVGSEKYAYKLEWLSVLHKLFAEEFKPEEHIVLCGDFNIATEDRDVYDPVSLAGTILLSDAERAAIDELRQWGMTDVFRQHHQDAGLYSWWDYRMNAFARNLGLRIDHIWATADLASRSRSIYIDKEPRKGERPSDHVPVVVDFAV
ncbi:MAG: exodeoxyribonuclease III [Candidatus Obscuribacterales bacterium]|jgi:exodeoxyribonuclease III|nr:exodeoxyribonuclease III [Candidatus Obscuribacterales bacterium]